MSVETNQDCVVQGLDGTYTKHIEESTVPDKSGAFPGTFEDQNGKASTYHNNGYVKDGAEKDLDENLVAVTVKDPEKGMNGHGPSKDEASSSDDVYEHPPNAFSRCVEKVEDIIYGFVDKHWTWIKLGIYLTLLFLYLLYFSYCMSHRYGDEGSIVLVVVTVFIFFKIFLAVLDYKGITIQLPKSFYRFAESEQGLIYRRKGRIGAIIVALAGMVLYLGIEVFPNNVTNLQSFCGMVSIVVVCFIFSKKPSRVNWHPVFWSFTLQFVLAFFTLRTKFGYDMFKWLGDFIQTFFDFSEAGSEFVLGKDYRDWGLAFTASGVIIFSNAVIFLLTHWGVIEFIVLKMGGFLAFFLETGPVESVVAAANIFISLTEAPLMVRPYLPKVTKSEIHTIVTCGFSSTSGGVMGLFIMMGAPPNHLLTAAVISAPAALAVSKLLYPEMEKICMESQANIRMQHEERKGAFTAYADGAVMAVALCVGAWSNMLAFVSMLNLLDNLVMWIGDRAGVDGLTFSMICSYVLYPLVWVMGVDSSDCLKAGEMMGIKLFATPFISYNTLGILIDNREELQTYMATSNDTTWYYRGDDIYLEASNTTLVGGVMTQRTEVILTYAMLGLSAFPALGMTIGTMVPLCPQRKQDIVDVLLRAFFAGNMACFATAAIAGVLFTEELGV